MLTGQIRTPNPWTIEITNKFNHPKENFFPLGGGWISRLYLLQDLFTNVSRSNFPQPAATTGWPGALRISFDWKKHHVVDDKLGQHCIASKVFYDVFLEVHNSMLHAHVFIFTCHVIGTPVFVCPTFLPETPRTRQNFSDSRPRRGNHPSKGQACGPSLAGGGICTGRLSRDRWRTEGFVRKISVQTYNFEMWSGRFVILWTLCVCFLPVWFLRSKKKPAQNIVQLLGNTKSLTFHEFSSFIDT